jgi:hypothetical protein
MATAIIRHSIPLSTRINAEHAKDILARDRARFKRMFTGKHRHGQRASHEARKEPHLPLQVAPGDSVDVTDAGMFDPSSSHSITDSVVQVSATLYLLV